MFNVNVQIITRLPLTASAGNPNAKLIEVKRLKNFEYALQVFAFRNFRKSEKPEIQKNMEKSYKILQTVVGILL